MAVLSGQKWRWPTCGAAGEDLGSRSSVPNPCEPGARSARNGQRWARRTDSQGRRQPAREGTSSRRAVDSLERAMALIGVASRLCVGSQRMMHKLDIKPHQSPRRAAVQLQARHPRTESISSVTNSPLLLAGRAPPEMDKEDGDADVLGEGVVGKHTKKQDDGAASGKRRQVKRRKTVDASVKPPKHASGDSAQPRRQSVSLISSFVVCCDRTCNSRYGGVRACLCSCSARRKPVRGIGTSWTRRRNLTTTRTRMLIRTSSNYRKTRPR